MLEVAPTPAMIPEQTSNLPNRFFELPPELREMIYLEYIRDHPFEYHISKVRHQNGRQRPSELTNLLRAHPQIHAEAAPLIRKYAKIIIPNIKCKECAEATDISIPTCFRDIAFQNPPSPKAVQSLLYTSTPSTSSDPVTPRRFDRPLPNTYISCPDNEVHARIHGYPSITNITLPFILYALQRARTFSYIFVPTGDGHRSAGRRVLLIIDKHRHITLEGLARTFVEQVKLDLLKVYKPNEGTKVTEVWKFPTGEPRVTFVNEEDDG